VCEVANAIQSAHDCGDINTTRYNLQADLAGNRIPRWRKAQTNGCICKTVTAAHGNRTAIVQSLDDVSRVKFYFGTLARLERQFADFGGLTRRQERKERRKKMSTLQLRYKSHVVACYNINGYMLIYGVNSCFICFRAMLRALRKIITVILISKMRSKAKTYLRELVQFQTRTVH